MSELFYFFSYCKLPGITDRKKTLKGLCICLIHLECLFSYNLSAIKCGFFFFISRILVVCVPHCVKVSCCPIKLLQFILLKKRFLAMGLFG